MSKSQLDMVAKNPALLQWINAAPVDTEKLKALDMGTALHCKLLEPEEFSKRFILAPEFNRRTTAGKEAEAAFLKDCEHTGKTVMDAEQGRKLQLMRDSVMAHRRRGGCWKQKAIANRHSTGLTRKPASYAGAGQTGI